MMVRPLDSMNKTAGSLPAGAAPLKHAAERFEAVFLRQIIGSMRQAHLAQDIMGSSATDNFREMADANTADSIAKTGSFGIAALIERQLGKAMVPDKSAKP